MSTHSTTDLDLRGDGAAYVRVSDDQQDTERQYAALRAFEKRHGVTIPKQHWFKDEGWARDTADRRPDFQRLMKLAEAGVVKWIVVSERDRFGTTDADEFVYYRYRLRRWGCRLFDAAGTDWTRKDIATVITAVVEGEKSEQEQHGISKRTLGGKAAKARAGEWQGGPVRLGFDVVCFQRETDRELWRVVFEGRARRLKVYPDGHTERFDGEANFPKFQPATEVLRVAPSRDKTKIAAAVSVFERFAAESISFTALAHYLNELGYRNSYGGLFQGHHVESMLEDPVYIGYYSWNKRHFGKFHRWANGQAVLELNYDEKGSRNAGPDWVQSRRLFDPLVSQPTWSAVQSNLAERPRRTNAPRSAALYLAGLVYCGNCGGRMVAGPVRRTSGKLRKDGHTGDRHEFCCGTYFKAVREGRRRDCKCLRNGVFQDTLEDYIGRYLDETGQRLQLLTGGLDAGNLGGRLEADELGAWRAFVAGIDRLTGYLAEHHPADYDALLRADQDRHAEADSAVQGSADASRPDQPRPSLADLLGEQGRRALEQGAHGPAQPSCVSAFLADCLDCYRALFDPRALEAELASLRQEHDRLVDGWADLPTKRAKETASSRLAALDARLGELEREKQDAAAAVEQQVRDLYSLQTAVAAARQALADATGERALRQRAGALQAVIQRIECTFTATGQHGGGWGKKSARLATVTIYPVGGGDPMGFAAGSKSTLLYSSAHSCM
jgi:DNA invertase Pin-like site-specific DNA recombinase